MLKEIETSKPADKIRVSLVSDYTDCNESEHICSLEIANYPMVEPLVVRRKQHLITSYPKWLWGVGGVAVIVCVEGFLVNWGSPNRPDEKSPVTR